MTTGTVLVTGAAGGQQGQTGRRVTELLRARGVPVRAMVRTLDDRADHLRGLGAEVVVADFLDFGSMQKAVTGVSTVYFAYPVQDGLLDATVNMAVAARNAGVTRLVDMVMLVSSPDAPTPRLRENYLSEQVFEWAGIGAAHVRATVFFENIRSLASAAIAEGVFAAPFGPDETVIPLVAGKDVARVAAGVLTAAEVLEGSSYRVIGQVMTVKEIVAALARGLDRDVEYHDILSAANADFAVTDTIEKLGLGRPTTFDEFMAEEKAGFPGL